MIASREVATHTIRFPEGLKERVQKSAQTSHRSFNSEVLSLLDQALGGDGSLSVTTLDVEVARAIKAHVDAEVQRRLRDIAFKIGEA